MSHHARQSCELERRETQRQVSYSFWLYAWEYFPNCSTEGTDWSSGLLRQMICRARVSEGRILKRRTRILHARHLCLQQNIS
jgi:hypothetical protein